MNNPLINESLQWLKQVDLLVNPRFNAFYIFGGTDVVQGNKIIIDCCNDITVFGQNKIVDLIFIWLNCNFGIFPKVFNLIY